MTSNLMTLATQHTEEQRCSVCEQFKPIYVVNNRTLALNLDYRPQWKYHVRLGGTKYAAVCPDCVMLFKEYGHE